MADQENIKQEYTNATIGLNLDQTVNQIKKGTLTYALNAAVENYDANSINYQNEEGNEICLVFPDEMVLIGKIFISEKNKHIFFLTNPDTGASEIGYMDNNDCVYHTLINAPCLNFSIDHPILKAVHKINNCSTEIYWTDGFNPRRYLDIDNIPKKLKYGSDLCDPVYTNDLDCNQLKLQPNFLIPTLNVTDVISGGNLVAGAYQFAIQYADALGNPYTSYQSVTNPTPIADPKITSVNFNYPVGKSIVVEIGNLDSTGQFQYFNLAVLKTINAITTVQLVGTFYIDNTTIHIIYTGQNVEAIQLAIEDIFEKFPYYDIAQDLTATQEILVWDKLTSIDRINYQSIASKIVLQWETWRIPATENYADEINATNLRSYLRDEVYAFEICFLLRNGKQTDSFHIPGRIKNNNENEPDIPETNPDFIGEPDYVSGGIGYSPYWKIYNTASVSGNSDGHSTSPSYKGPWKYGDMAYWESTEEYPCNEAIWGDLVGQKIRHHKFPDVLVSPIFESKIFIDKNSMAMGNDAVFPIGVHVSPSQISAAIAASTLTKEQKDDIVGYKILRGDRGTNKSIVAKGILRNVGKYTREEEEFYYPNYPYNDLAADPFLTVSNNAFTQLCDSYEITITELVPNLNGAPYADIQLTSCDTNKQYVERVYALDTYERCSTSKPVLSAPAKGTVSLSTYELWNVWNSDPINSMTFSYVDTVAGYTEVTLCPSTSIVCDHYTTINVAINTNGPVKVGVSGTFNSTYAGTHTGSINCKTPPQSQAIDSTLADRQIFNSPETSFGQPFLGTVLKIENTIYGTGRAHFVQVKDNAKYRLLSEAAQRTALDTSNALGALTLPTNFDTLAMFTAYQAYLEVYINGITRKNYAYSFNSIGDYNYSVDVPNNQGIKQRNIDISRYLIPGVQSVGDDHPINNYQRETSIFIKTTTALPFPTAPVDDYSRFTISERGLCATPAKQTPIYVASYYASLKNNIVNQWGQLYSYNTIDTGFERIIDVTNDNNTVFGGDTFISRFAFKTKLPFFIDNRVNAPDDSDIFYDEIGNVAYPKYWHSARSILKDYVSDGGLLSNIISYKAHNFDCPNDGSYEGAGTSTTSTTTTTLPVGTTPDSTTAMYYDGYFYLFAYGVPNFYCESSYNTDLRQAFNNREGDFWPHVSTDIPDDWVQESFVPIAQDNSYYYNTTFSKQNKENEFTHLPLDWDKPCFTYYPFRAIYSDVQTADAQNRVNAWLTYRASSYFDFPQNYGPLTSLDGIQNRAILARFENKSLLYNNLLTIDTSNPQAAYVGNSRLFEGAPPIDFAETDLGYVGSQHKMLLKIPQGQVTVDAKRGQVFLISNTQAIDLSAFGSGMNRFFTDHLAFEILRYYPDINVDNHYNGVGLHGVYDSKYDRIILTKLDYIPRPEYADILKFDAETGQFYIDEEVNTDSTTSTSTSTTTSTTSTTTTSTTTSSTTTTTTTMLLEVFTFDVTNIDLVTFSAIGGGEIIVNETTNITTRGICWNTTGSPTLSDDFTTDGSDPGSFSTTIQGLSCGLTYYVRAYVTINSVTTYGNEVMFDVSSLFYDQFSLWNTLQVHADCTLHPGDYWNFTGSFADAEEAVRRHYACHIGSVNGYGGAILRCKEYKVGGILYAGTNPAPEYACIIWPMSGFFLHFYTIFNDSPVDIVEVNNGIIISITPYITPTTTTTSTSSTTTTTSTSSTTTTTTTSIPGLYLVFSLTTDSTLSNWSPYSISKTGTALRWIVSGAVNYDVVNNIPTFNFSTVGEKIINVYATDDPSLLTILRFDKYATPLGLKTFSIGSAEGLLDLELQYNSLTSLELNGNASLNTLLVNDNPALSSLDVSTCLLLSILSCANTNISSLNITNNTELFDVDVSNTPIASIDLSNQLYLYSFSGGHSFSTIDLSNNLYIEQITIENSAGTISSLDLSNNPLLWGLFIDHVNISSIDLSAFTSLLSLGIKYTSITDIDITNNSQLIMVDVTHNKLTAASINEMLDTLYTFAQSGEGFDARFQDPDVNPDQSKADALQYDYWSIVLI